MALTLHVQQPGEWRAARDLRIAMLADTPIAYVDTLERAQARSDAEWELRYRVQLGNLDGLRIIPDEPCHLWPT